jgi:molybdopterin molybdotransferase
VTEFLNLIPPQEALQLLLSSLADETSSEILVPTVESMGCVVASDILSPYHLPTFPRSTVDGYALQAKDTYGSSDSMPSYLELVGEVLMGHPGNFELSTGQAVLIHTGGMVPANADAVIMIEDTQLVGKNELEIRKAVASGENLLAAGEEIGADITVIPAGKIIRSVEIGGLMALGIMEISVRSKPRVGIISSGDEIVFPGSQLNLGQVKDVNSYLLSSLISKWGGEPVIYGIVQDNLEELISVARKAYENCDIVVFTAGSSVSVRDVTAKAIRSLGNPGLLVHGVNIKPGKPTILANCSNKPVIGLPGNPVSAYITANIFVSPLVKHLLGIRKTQKPPTISATLSINIPSQAGREDWIPVSLCTKNHEIIATPIFAKSNFIFSLVSAHGLIRIEPDQTGLDAGKNVEVFIFE